jgi:hypothetical protein
VRISLQQAIRWRGIFTVHRGYQTWKGGLCQCETLVLRNLVKPVKRIRLAIRLKLFTFLVLVTLV